MRLHTEERQRLGKQSAVCLGWDAYKAGEAVGTNPFPRRCDEWDEWLKGWRDARTAAEKKTVKKVKK